jgi:DNA repair protein RecN (Recombination protein N)
MLHELRIENLLLIERAELRFGPGLNSITGETGAGKTILARSLDLLLGGRARPQIVRPGASEAYVEGVFELPEKLLDEPELVELRERLPEGESEIALGRRVGISGRTSAFVQGRMASAADLRTLGHRLLAFYGQHEHRRLLLGAVQEEILDGFAGRDQLELRDAYRRAHAEVVGLTRELERLGELDGARERDLDLLRYELEEIEAAAPDRSEAEALADELSRLRHADALRRAAGGALARVVGEDESGGAAALLAEAEGELGATRGVEARLDEIGARVAALALELVDVASELRSYLDCVEGDPGRLAACEERLDGLERLKRKHGGSIESVLGHAERCRVEIARLEGAEERSEALERELAAAIDRRREVGERLSAGRERAASELEERVASELALLAMDGGRLEVVLEPHPEGFGPHGRESVELQLATNPGMPPGPLREAASGGELSRVMLALSGLASGGAGTVVFDEIDAGIGGKTARAVGERLRRLAERAGGEEARQVICITHLPQVASLATTHFRISKRASGGRTRASVERVEGEELVAEICRMLGAERGDEVASRHARELLAAAA